MKLISEIWGSLPFQVRAMTVAGIGIFIILLFVLGGVRSCRDKNTEKKIEQLGVNARTSEIEANVLTNQKIEVERNANQANANLDAVLGTDTGNRDGNFGAVKRKFCADHPNDSKCK